jgi:hypothetical protein
MPLMHSKSKKAFGKNVAEEMHAGKPQPQALAIAYSIKRKAGKKKMAEGGEVNISAKTEKRPMPNDTHGDSDETRRNKGNKAPGQDSWTDTPTIKQAQRPSITKLSQPRMVESSVLTRKLRTQEGDLMDSEAPASPKEQPDNEYNESDAKKMGSDPDMPKPHTTSKAYTKSTEDDDTEDRAEDDMKQSYAKGGKVNTKEDEGIDMTAWMKKKAAEGSNPFKAVTHIDGKPVKKLAKGGMIDPSKQRHSASGAHDEEYGDGAEDDMHPDDSPLDGLDDEETQPVDEYMSTNRMAPMLADGGEIGRSPDDSEMGGDWSRDNDYYDDEGREDSVAAAVMARRNRLHDEVDSGAHDLDESAMYAEGGEVDLSMNHDEEPNNEDQMSFQALKKENYNSSNLDVEQPEDSNLKGDSEESDSENKHDHIEEMRKKMMARSQFSQK